MKALHKMLFTKQLCLLCSEAVAKRLSEKSSNKVVRKFSSQNSGKRSKKPNKVVITAKNDFVTHQLNTSIAAHLLRQQKILNYVEEEERKILKQSRKSSNNLEENCWKNDSYSRAKVEKKAKFSQKNYQSKDHNGRNLFYENNPTKLQLKNCEKKSNKKNAVALYDSSRNHCTESDSDDFELEELETPNWNDMELIRMDKSFYVPSDETESRSADEIDAFHLKMHIKCSKNTPKPIIKFNELYQLPEKIIADIEEQNLMECTAIQAQGLPMALSGINMICVAQSG